ncbi:MAG TPA: heme exporter protein CcmB [Chitinophagaceae bacterium]|nr:heme exporter protein CcmB [Chitinophagaceae bacterium]
MYCTFGSVIGKSAQIFILIKKDLLLEWRQKYAFYGVLLYVGSTVLVIYTGFLHREERVWNAMFWITQLFITVNTIAKSFLQDSPGRMLYYQSTVSARIYILSKLAYNLMLMLVMSVLSLGLFLAFLGNPLINPALYLGMVCLGGISLSMMFTMLAAISAKAGQNAALMVIMGFPMVIPALIVLVNASATAFQPGYQPGLFRLVLILGCLDLLSISLSLILFPFLWKN